VTYYIPPGETMSSTGHAGAD